MGISPLVKMIERQRAIPIGKRLPRWLAILIIYATIIAVVVSVGMIVIPPLIDQAEELWRSLPERFAQAQATLVRLGILRRPVTLGEAVQQTPASGGATAVTHDLQHGAERRGRRVRHHHAAAAHVLHAGRVARDLHVLRAAVSASRARPRGGGERDGDREGERVARRAIAARRHHRIDLRDRPVADGRAVFLRARRSSRRSAS